MKIKGSELGYHGKGVPDADTILRLQRQYSEAVLARGNLPPETLTKLKRMQDIAAKADDAKKTDEKARLEASNLAAELAPILHFKVDDVDWDR